MLKSRSKTFIPAAAAAAEPHLSDKVCTFLLRVQTQRRISSSVEAAAAVRALYRPHTARDGTAGSCADGFPLVPNQHYYPSSHCAHIIHYKVSLQDGVVCLKYKIHCFYGIKHFNLSLNNTLENKIALCGVNRN